MKYDVFISYSRKDFDEVNKIVDILKSRINGLNIWFDITGIDSGDEFEEKIINAIDSSQLVLFALSNNSLQSAWTKDEVIYAKNTGKKIVPLLLKDAELKDWFLFKFGRIDCIDTNDSKQLNKLIGNLSKWINKTEKVLYTTQSSNDINQNNKQDKKITLSYINSHRRGCLISVTILILLIALIPSWFDSNFFLYPHKQSHKQYASTTTLLHTIYYFKITTLEHGVERFVVDTERKKIHIYDGTNGMYAFATGFFISNDGVIVTNLYITAPWLFGKDMDVLEMIQMAYHEEFNIALADIKVEGVVESIEAVPNGKSFDEANATKLHKITESETIDIDLVVLQTIDHKIIPGSTYIPLNKLRVDNVPVGEKIYTMGFSDPGFLQDLGESEKDLTKVLQVTSASGEITMNNDTYTYGFNVQTSQTLSSGLPILDRKGRLVGITAKRVDNTQGYNFAIRAKYLQHMIDKVKYNNE